MESDKTINNIRNFLKGLWCLLKHTEPPQDIKFIYNGPKNLLYQHLKNYLNINPFNLIIKSVASLGKEQQLSFITPNTFKDF